MKVLLTGAASQLGQALIAAKPAGITLNACSRAELDLANALACQALVQRRRPDWLLNARIKWIPCTEKITWAAIGAHTDGHTCQRGQ